MNNLIAIATFTLVIEITGQPMRRIEALPTLTACEAQAKYITGDARAKPTDGRFRSAKGHASAYCIRVTP